MEAVAADFVAGSLAASRYRTYSHHRPAATGPGRTALGSGTGPPLVQQQLGTGQWMQNRWETGWGRMHRMRTGVPLTELAGMVAGRGWTVSWKERSFVVVVVVVVVVGQCSGDRTVPAGSGMQLGSCL